MEIGVGIVFLIFGLVSSAAGFLLFCNAYRKLRTWNTVPGTVIGYRESGFKNQLSYMPQVQFIAADGKLVTFYSSVGSSRKPYGIGDPIKILCPSDDPERATIKSFSNLCILPVFALFYGISFASLGLYLIFGQGGSRFS